MSLIHLEKLSKHYRISQTQTENVLRSLTAVIEASKLTALYGPSGCGKTSLLNILSGLDRDYEGRVLFKGQDFKELSEQELTLFRKEHIGFVFQNFNLIAHQSVLDNVLLPLYLKGISHKEMVARAEKVLEDLDMLAFKDKNVKQLSGGQKQRVAIARALVNDPDLIVADEPTGSLDSKSQEMVLEIFQDLVKEGKTVLVVTHNPEVADYADVIIKMKDGEIIEESKGQKE
ncbi:ABC transporter ATP-binding protein [Streptococcus sp. sy004]|uniref:ABC transporter ATP-binding protein n=1 Tax=Streptococcus sp. sy004 TaxID=2600149 RepID=UPI0011B6DF47|nr:ABC transporter ATP-binding protein [Streptococcus sp. sy004]TWT09923.1 ABC transporter ATP-binding protein [Streptococcus sp. sy004]